MADKWHAAETVRVIVLPAETLADRLGKKPYFADRSHGRKQEIAESLRRIRMVVSLGRKHKFAD